jgi:hypothetical protein
VKSSFVPIASDTAVMETLTMQMDEMVTFYSKDRDSIVLMHYCPTNNQPRMRAVPSAEPITDLVFSFQDAENLPALQSVMKQACDSLRRSGPHYRAIDRGYLATSSDRKELMESNNNGYIRIASNGY